MKRLFTSVLVVSLLLGGISQSKAQNCCLVPVQNFASNIMQHSAKLNWSYFPAGNCPDPLKFQLRYKPSNAANWTMATVPWANVNTYSYNATMLFSNKTYSWQVRTVCMSPSGYIVMSQWTTLQTFTTLRISDELNQTVSAINLYPNPASTEFILEVPAEPGDNIHVRILDLAGKSLITEQYIADGEAILSSISIGSIPSGLYFVEVLQNDVKNIFRFVKE